MRFSRMWHRILVLANTKKINFEQFLLNFCTFPNEGHGFQLNVAVSFNT